ncbi:MAG TPA: hypothetical protein VGI92_01960 [Gemmatimonadales bacterium]|jgi:hypothetical protein
MELSVRGRGDAVATFRFINVHLMETLAGWVPTTPELEVKVLFGRHLWDFAQHADAFGKRAAELRLQLHASRAPTAELQGVLDDLRRTTRTAQRLGRLYHGVVPGVERLYTAYLAQVDELMDEPTVRIIGHGLLDTGRMGREAESLSAQGGPSLENGAGSTASGGPFGSLDRVIDFRPAVAAEAEA